MKKMIRLCRREAGFTFLESIVGSAITALVLASLVGLLFQFNTVTRQQNASLDINNQLRSAGVMLNHDVGSAAVATVSQDLSTLTLLMPEYTFGQEQAPVTKTVQYVFSGNDATLSRVEGESQVVVARNLSSVSFGEAGDLPEAIQVDIVASSHDARGNEEQAASISLDLYRRVSAE